VKVYNGLGRKDFDQTGGVGEFTVIAPPDCSWRVEYKPDWITINSGASGVGMSKVIFTVAPLPDASAGWAPGFVGLDQVNALLPKTLRGAGKLSVSVAVEG